MAGFIYFAKRGGGLVTLELAKQWGLDYAFESAVECRGVQRHPSGSRGQVFAEVKRNGGKDTMVSPDQTWRKMPSKEGRPELWVGYWNDAKPTPSDLARSEMIVGVPCELADGNKWQVPIVRRHEEGEWRSVLPCYMDYDEGGNIIPGKPLDRYMPLWDQTARIGDWFYDELNREAGRKVEVRDRSREDEVTDKDMWDATIALLKANYVVDLPELIALKALADNGIAAVACLYSCQFQELNAWNADIKKKETQSEEGGLTTSDGNGALPETTPQLGLTVEP